MSIYRKKGTSRWWMSYKNAAGEWDDESTGCTVESDAQAVHDATVDAIAAGQAAPHRGPATVRSFTEKCMAERRERKLESVEDDDARLTNHILPALGDLELTALRPKLIQAWVRALKEKSAQRREGKLAPRTVRHCFNLLKTMMNDAVAEELIPSNPCVLKKGDLPRKVDKDPAWRGTAMFSRAEVEQLISDERVPPDRRMWIALHFLAGLRPGEGSALRWSDYDERAKPLGRLVVSKAMNRKRDREKKTKTEIPRDVPVHPTLAKMLAAWKLSGWQAMFHRPPRAEDLIVPARAPTPAEQRLPGWTPRPRGNSQSLKRFHQDLERLGLKLEGPKPFRRFYDSRRTFITLCLADGALKDIFKWVTHPATEDQTDEYTAIPYAAKAGEVAKLKVELLSGVLLAMPKAVNSREPGPGLPTALPTDAPQQNKTPKPSQTWGPKLGGVYGTRSLVRDSQGEAEGSSASHIPRAYAAPKVVSIAAECSCLESGCRNCRKTLRVVARAIRAGGWRP